MMSNKLNERAIISDYIQCGYGDYIRQIDLYRQKKHTTANGICRISENAFGKNVSFAGFIDLMSRAEIFVVSWPFSYH
jgi:hypothetical protein